MMGRKKLHEEFYHERDWEKNRIKKGETPLNGLWTNEEWGQKK